VYDIYINLTNKNGCITDIDTFIHIFPEPHPDFILDPDSGCAPLDVYFENSSYILDTSSGYLQSLIDHGIDMPFIKEWYWYFDDPPSSIPDGTGGNTAQHLYLNSSIYYPSLEVETNNECTNIITKPVVIYPTPTAVLNVVPVPGRPGTYTFDASESLIPSPLDSSDFWHFWTITTILQSGDTITDSVSPTAQYPWIATNEFDVPNYPGNNVNSWEYIFTSSYDMIDAEATICVILENITGYICPADTCVTITDIVPFYGLWVPNAIHPGNSSGGYETFLPKGKGILIDENGVSQYELAIFDKFGNLIFKTNEVNPADGSPVIGWDGTKNGEPLPQGTYVWKIYAQFSDGTYWPGTGIGHGKATGGDEDPWIKRNQTGLRSGAVYLIR
tara:strand:- start:603 stop:1766 length:1164 start_codon:yes stop_codon:yes gene_type:complete